MTRLRRDRLGFTSPSIGYPRLGPMPALSIPRIDASGSLDLMLPCFFMA